MSAHLPASRIYMSERNELEASSPPSTISLLFQEDIEWLSLAAGWLPVVAAFVHVIVSTIQKSQCQRNAQDSQKGNESYVYLPPLWGACLLKHIDASPVSKSSQRGPWILMGAYPATFTNHNSEKLTTQASWYLITYHLLGGGTTESGTMQCRS